MPIGNTTSYHERLTVPIRWWVQATMFLASIWIAFIVATAAWVAWGVTAVCVVLTLMLLLKIGSARVAVVDGVLYADAAHIELRFLGNPEVLDAEQTRRAAGMEADARAFFLLRPYLKESVRVPIDDPRDPAPYWLLASRHPGELAAVLTTGISQQTTSSTS
ncbi:MAG: DUF3093 domain-containing protein [Marmoricola sp.]